MKSVFLDFDGTLVDIKPRHYEVYRRCVMEFKGVPLRIDEYWNLKRHDTPWSEVLRLSSLDTNAERQFLAYFIDLIEKPQILKIDQLFDDALDVVARLKKDYRVYLVSLRRSHENLLGQLEHLGLQHAFENVLSGHSDTKKGVLNKKADVIKELGEYGRGYIIGDTEADIAVSHQLPDIESIAVTTGIRDESVLAKDHPDQMAASLQDAAKYLD